MENPIFKMLVAIVNVLLVEFDRGLSYFNRPGPEILLVRVVWEYIF